MNQIYTLFIYAITLFIGRIADLGTTYLLSPKMKKEANHFNKILYKKGGWPLITAINLIFVITGSLYLTYFVDPFIATMIVVLVFTMFLLAAFANNLSIKNYISRDQKLTISKQTGATILLINNLVYLTLGIALIYSLLYNQIEVTYGIAEGLAFYGFIMSIPYTRAIIKKHLINSNH